MMKSDLSAILDDMLAEWHEHCDKYSPLRRQSKSVMFKDVGTNRQYDAIYEIHEEKDHKDLMDGITKHTYDLGQPYMAAIEQNARNIACRAVVWGSPYLPTDQAERAIIVRDARTKLMQRLMDAGLL